MARLLMNGDHSATTGCGLADCWWDGLALGMRELKKGAAPSPANSQLRFLFSAVPCFNTFGFPLLALFKYGAFF